ncbi:HutD family protein [Rheinheimera sp.]|uniref:HutD/Ves family protein n=1 Tax=Rheinheimera sp. TaxID=1869214 RepID=UPI002355E1D3|nr:HutD family protein [Rheinheimera sp.]
MSVNIITPQQWQTQRWQNGGGITHQLCRKDDEHGLLWRVSVAEVASDGPFSRFDNIDRVIMLLAGAGFSLMGVGDNPQLLATPLAPFSFAGETPIHCSLINGAVRDFNLMTRRHALTAALEVLTLNSEAQLLPMGKQTILFVVKGGVEAAVNGQRFTLDTEHSLLLHNEKGTLQLSAGSSAKVIFIRLEATAEG